MKSIKIKGARENNLRDIDVEIPRDKFVVITGLSGSGKSSLAFDTIYAEGQRRYVESLSSYARQFLGVMQKPDVDYIEGLSPAISIDQKSASRNPRSTVGTVTEIYDYLRLLFARAGIPHCPKCKKKISGQSATAIANKILNGAKKDWRIAILAPVVHDKKGEHKLTFGQINKAGFSRVRVDGSIIDLDEAENLDLDRQKKHTIEVVVDRIIIEEEKSQASNKKRLFDSVEKALDLGDGQLIIYDFGTKKDIGYSEKFACTDCGISLPEIAPRSFSFNSPHGACRHCQGLGIKKEIDPKRIFPNPRLSILEGAIRPWARSAGHATWYFSILEKMAGENNINLNCPVGRLKKEDLKKILYGSGQEFYTVRGYSTRYEGVIPNLLRRYDETESDYIRKEIDKYMIEIVCPSCNGARLSDYIRKEIDKYMIEIVCPSCNGARLRSEVLGVKIAQKNITQVSELTVSEAKKFFSKLNSKLNQFQKEIAKQIVKEISARLQFLSNVGLDYLSIDRNAATLSGGEAQRIRLATQIGSGLMGVIYILDEPSIGLHQKDNKKLIGTLKKLRDLGNSVIVVEHDEETMRSSDHIIDVGPGAGKGGGKIVATGTLDQIKKTKHSMTADYLTGRKFIATPKIRRMGTGNLIKIIKASQNNLKNIDVEIPLGKIICVSGVSGSGKSSLVCDVLARSLAAKYHRAEETPGKHLRIENSHLLDKVISIDQSPIGKSPRSNPATYTGVFAPIRELFASTQEARMRGYKAGRFSFNVRGGRCEKCRGDGVLKIEMHFLPNVYITCEECKGKRYNSEALEIHYRGKSIADILDMTVFEASKFFVNIPQIYTKLSVLDQVGLGYIKLGQPATTLSGGEAQRVKLATELSRRSTGSTLYILDEPTTGLHFDDIKKLLLVLNSLVDKGNTVMVIEHNLDVIKSADHIIDLGPEGGEKGGEVIASGTPEEIAKVPTSDTGKYLRRILKSTNQ